MSKGDTPVVDLAKKDSFDVFVSAIPERLQDEYGVPAVVLVTTVPDGVMAVMVVVDGSSTTPVPV